MKRAYPYKNLSMLTATSTVIENFLIEKEAFVNEHVKWADPFGSNLQTRVDHLLKEYFGINSKEQLKETTKQLNQLQKKSTDNLGMVKVQVERGYRKNKERKDYLLEKLGFKEYWKKALYRNQNALMGLLIKFANNLDSDIRTEMELNSVSSSRISAILDDAVQLTKINVSQETLKGTSRIDTQNAVVAFNEIYEQALDICQVGKKLFKDNKTKRSLFVFSQLVQKQGGSVETSTT